MSIDPLVQNYRLETFRFRGNTFRVNFTGSIAVASGVVCDTYTFDGDDTRDLGIIKIMPGCQTPRQRVLGGDYTIEGHVAGAGRLLVAACGDEFTDRYEVQEHSGSEPFELTMALGGIMQWVAATNMPLVASEVCYPPYQDGRFENLD